MTMDETATTGSIVATNKKSLLKSSKSKKSSSTNSSLLGRLRIVKATNSSRRNYYYSSSTDRIDEKVVTSSYPTEVVLVVNNNNNNNKEEDGGHSGYNDDGFSLNSVTNHDHDGHDGIINRNDSNDVIANSSFDGGIETSLESMRRLTKKPSKFTFDLMPSFSLESIDDGQDKGIVITKEKEQQADHDPNFMMHVSSSKQKDFGGTKAFRNRTRTSSTVATSEDDDNQDALLTMTDDHQKQKDDHPAEVATTARVEEKSIDDNAAKTKAAVATAATSIAYGASTPRSIGFWPSLVTPENNLSMAAAGSKHRATTAKTTISSYHEKKDASSTDDINKLSSMFAGLSSWSIFG